MWICHSSTGVHVRLVSTDFFSRFCIRLQTKTDGKNSLCDEKQMHHTACIRCASTFAFVYKMTVSQRCVYLLQRTETTSKIDCFGLFSSCLINIPNVCLWKKTNNYFLMILQSIEINWSQALDNWITIVYLIDLRIWMQIKKVIYGLELKCIYWTLIRSKKKTLLSHSKKNY